MSNRGIVKRNLVIGLALISSFTCGYDTSMMNGLQASDKWKESFNYPGPAELGLINAVQNIGQILAYPFAAKYCDYYGRRNALVTSAMILLLGVGLQGGARNKLMFILSRGVVGFGVALNVTAAPLLIIELAYPTQAAPLVSTGRGEYLLSAKAYPAQLRFFYVSSSKNLPVGLFLLTETKRRALIVKYHANGDPNDPIVESELKEIQASVQLDYQNKKSTSYLTFFQGAANRRRFFIILAVSFFSQWSGNGVISYYLTVILNSIGYKTQEIQTLINAVASLWSMVVGIVFSAGVNKFRRRTLFLFSTAGCWASYVVWTGLEATYENSLDAEGNGGNEAAAKGVVVIIFIFNTLYAVGWGTLQITYSMEILPFSLRARGLVLYNLFCALALLFNQYANPIGIDAIGWKFYIAYDVWILFELVVIYFLLVETSGKANLEEVAAILDGKATENYIAMTSVHGDDNYLVAKTSAPEAGIMKVD